MTTVIVGGGAAGASCAARLRRLNENEEILILEATNEISIANCGLPYYCSNVIQDRDVMIVAKPTLFKELLNVDVRFNSKVTAIDSVNKTVTVNNTTQISYTNLVLALGASPIIPNLAGVQNNKKIFTVRTLKNADDIKEHIAKTNAKNAVVIGAGYIGVEMAENFVEMGLNTTLIEKSNQVLAPLDTDMAAFAHNEITDHKCNLLLQESVVGFTQNQVELESGKKIDYDIAILAIGVSPDTTIASNAGLKTGVRGSIQVNQYLETSVNNIYAAGDSIEVLDFVTNQPSLIPLAGPANRQGRIIADNIYASTNTNAKKQTYKNSLGSAVVKVFNKTVASVGRNEKNLQQQGVDYLKTIIWVNHHAGYYPGASGLALKVLFTAEGKILGAQAFGTAGVEKRIDVLATIIRLNGTVQDLIDSELTYAPPYSSAKDPVNIAGMSAQNILDNRLKVVFFNDIQNLDNTILLDVRGAGAFGKSTLPNAINIPAAEIRTRYNELPKDKKIVVFCARGFTSYNSVRTLMQLGFTNVYSFMGGKFVYDALAKDQKNNAK